MKNVNKLFIPAFFLLITFTMIGELFADSTQEKDEYPVAIHYPGGQDSLVAHIYDRLQYPPNAKRMRTQGTCIVHFTLKPDGSLTSVSVVKDVGNGTKKEAKRVVETLKFNAPGYEANYQIPVKFKL